MGKLLYDAMKQSFLEAPDVYDPEGAVFYRDVEIPCRHSFVRRFIDRLRGEPHGPTHVIAEPFIQVRLVDHQTPDPTALRVTWDATGRFRVDGSE